MNGTTERQSEVLAFIHGYTQNHTVQPTVREVASHLGISVKGAHHHIMALRKKGLLKPARRKKSRECGVNTQRADYPVMDIPILVSVAPEKPLSTPQNWSGSISVARDMLKERRYYFAYQVRGDSMTGVGIQDGDIAVIERRTMKVQSGEIALVLLEDTLTLKTLFRERTRLKLKPENPRYTSIYCSKDLRILGRLAFIIRPYTYSQNDDEEDEEEDLETLESLEAPGADAEGDPA